MGDLFAIKHLATCSLMSFNPQSVFRQVYNLFQNQLYKEGDILLPLSISSTLSFPEGIQQLLMSFPSSSCHFYPSTYLSFNNVFQKAVLTQDVTNPVNLSFLYCTQEIPCLLSTTCTMHSGQRSQLRYTGGLLSVNFTSFYLNTLR